MEDRPCHNVDGKFVDPDADSLSWPDCHWNLKDPRSCLEPDSCGCYVDPCEYFGVSPEDCCIDADILGGG